MLKPIILSAATSLLVTAAILLAAERASEAKTVMPTVETLIGKSGRLAAPEVIDEGWDEAASEWLLDCYDQFGPEGWQPDDAELNSCLTPS